MTTVDVVYGAPLGGEAVKETRDATAAQLYFCTTYTGFERRKDGYECDHRCVAAVLFHRKVCSVRSPEIHDGPLLFALEMSGGFYRLWKIYRVFSDFGCA